MTEHNSERSDRLHTERLTVANWDRLRRLERVSTKLDSQFRLPVVGGRFGWDSVIGLVPGLGDIAITLPSLFMIYEATRIGARRRTLVRMTANTAADFAIGSIHVAGDIFDVLFQVASPQCGAAQAGNGTPTAARRARQPSMRGAPGISCGALKEVWEHFGLLLVDLHRPTPRRYLAMEYGILGLLVLIANIYALVKTWGSGASTGAKLLWTLLILVLPVIGFIVWLLAGPKEATRASV